MSSLLTNNSAMVALQTLKSINKNLAHVQDQVSTGKRISNAWDNAALWGISTTMQTDVTGFKAISESLSLGSATLSVARDGAETVADLLDQMKGKVVAAQEDNVDRDKIQADVKALRDQIATVVDAASFNGLNLLKNVTSGDNTVNILASLNRGSDQTVSASNISFERTSLEASTTSTGPTTSGTADASTAKFTIGVAAAHASTAAFEGQMFALEMTRADGTGVTLSYTVTAADVLASDAAATTNALATKVAGAFTTQLNAADTAGRFDKGGIAFAGDANAVDFNVTGADIVAGGGATDVSTTLGGGLSAISMIDVSKAEGAAAALDAMEPLIQNAIDAAASFGSAQGRIQTQSEYVSKIMDGLKSGIGALVDADMEEASAELQALQVQQQFGIQALSIANQAPQNILALFR
jgi:flagellin